MVIKSDRRTAEAAPVLYRIPQATRALGLSRTVVYDLIRTGRLRAVKEGRTRLVPVTAVAEYVELLEREAGARR
ncbi:helix-turn-helix domain-containing protein [Streptomyces sp. DSM 41527]|uniref:Helix-turn-helix domain-containing protein n=1 Tax=Streptomyces mooreae TaxID=3075523 RepID=A0ABU2T701_9ACTN|nr:helix-turn-helix domain-containing protein [Streptomyces sp. DSM 41527]MDT0456805.1 helix-turn-helix domain-containing protein [Streptomyces sp. DSM 41527]